MDEMLFQDRKRDDGLSGLPLFGAPPTPPSNGIGTSDEAAESLTPERLDQYHRRILAVLDRHREEGATREELEGLTGIKGNTLRPRVLELASGGWVCCRRPDGTEIPLPERAEHAGEIRRETQAGKGASVVYLRRVKAELIDTLRERGRAA